MKIDNFWDDLTDISAKKEALAPRNSELWRFNRWCVNHASTTAYVQQLLNFSSKFAPVDSGNSHFVGRLATYSCFS